jgi:hypothetical protein
MTQEDLKNSAVKGLTNHIREEGTSSFKHYNNVAFLLQNMKVFVTVE